MDRLENPTRLRDHRSSQGGNYFDELLARIRDIRSSEKVFWRKLLEIYATSIDYDARTEASQLFFATVQNKMHWAAHGQTAAEVIAARADATKPNRVAEWVAERSASLATWWTPPREDTMGTTSPDRVAASFCWRELKARRKIPTGLEPSHRGGPSPAPRPRTSSLTSLHPPTLLAERPPVAG